MSLETLKRWFVGLAVVALLVILQQAGPVAASPSQQRWTPDTCVGTMNAVDGGGGSLTDQNYYVEYASPLDLGTMVEQGNAHIYFKDQEMRLAYHGLFNGVHRWGVSTKWAYVNWDWQNDENWKITYACNMNGA